MKILKLITSLLLSLVLLFSALPTLAQNEASSSGNVDVAGLFWPMIPGTTVADGTFWFKQLKEMFQGMMVFGDTSKARYETELSQKRIVEANKLFESKDYKNAIKSLEIADQRRESALKLKKKAFEAKQDVLELTTFMVTSFDKQKQVLGFFSLQAPGDQKNAISEQLKKIELQISEAK